MIDKYIYKFLDLLDKFGNYLDKVLFPKEKKKKRNRCKLCGCKCHCSDVLHNHFFDGDICTCDTCRH